MLVFLATILSKLVIGNGLLVFLLLQMSKHKAAASLGAPMPHPPTTPPPRKSLGLLDLHQNWIPYQKLHLPEGFSWVILLVLSIDLG